MIRPAAEGDPSPRTRNDPLHDANWHPHGLKDWAMLDMELDIGFDVFGITPGLADSYGVQSDLAHGVCQRHATQIATAQDFLIGHGTDDRKAPHESPEAPLFVGECHSFDRQLGVHAK